MFPGLCGQIPIEHIACNVVEAYDYRGDMDRQRFVSNLKTEIERRIESGRLNMSRLDVEQIGRKVQMSPDEAAEHFMDIRGQVWEGEIVSSYPQRHWTGVAFDPEWFWQRHSIRPL
jgi:hypothetical protein